MTLNRNPQDDALANDGDDDLPCAVGLLAATLALMTGHAAPEPGARVDTRTLQGLTARKIVSNLFFLQHHPDLPPTLRQVAARLHGRWRSLTDGAPRAAHAEPVHTPPDPSRLH